MCKNFIFIFVLILVFNSIVFSADLFYTNLLNEGKQLLLAGKYSEALESFKIAEFGLLDDKEILPELLFYYALAYFKQGLVTESRQMLDKLKTAVGATAVSTLPQPKEIEPELSIMTRTLKHLEQPGSKTGSLPFFKLFYETKDLIREKKLAQAELNINKLEKLNGDDKMLAFLQGFLAFQLQDYKKSIKKLEKISDALNDELREDASFYLAYSFYKREDAANGSKYALKIKDPGHVHSLMDLMDEIKARQGLKAKKR